MNKMIRTRFAPSPTGDPHIGNIRTALFAYLFAKHERGQFLLRIEDTDQSRHDENSIEIIKDALSWLKIRPDNFNEEMHQSSRLEIYKNYALELVKKGDAYVCNCSKERLEEVRQQRTANHLPPMYDKNCRDKALEYEENCVIRMRIPENEKIAFEDIIRGHVEFDTSTIDDQVILKSDGFPTYHLAHVVDDSHMLITHVIRAEEWLTSTPKHILLNRMLGFDQPQYAHLPVILGPDKKKLSKRHGATGILEYRKEGYLWQAMINFMVLLGWNPKTEQEIFGKADNPEEIFVELFEKFTLEGVNKAPAVFDLEKLNFFNRHYLQQAKPEDIVDVLDEETVAAIPNEKINQVIELAKERMTTLSDFKETIDYIIEEPKLDKRLIVFKKSDPETTKKALGEVITDLEELTAWEKDGIKAVFTKVVEEGGFSNGDVFWPIRYALSGKEKSPPPEEIATVLDKEKTIARIQKALEELSNK